MTATIRPLAFEEACAVVDRWPGRPVPATLHPAYVASDARRNAALEPWFLCFDSGGERWLHSLHSTQIAGTPWRDASSPYGYGGPLSSSTDPVFLNQAWDAYAAWMRQAGVVVEYLRFHPLLGNERGYCGRVEDNREVVAIDLTATDPLAACAARTRQAVRKALAAGVLYDEQPLAACSTQFGAFHRSAMRAIGADPFYLFEDSYYEALGRMPQVCVGVCARPGAHEWLAAALFLDGAGVREYHLAAASSNGRALGAASLLLSQAALQARDHGASTLYLGGGTDGRPDNPLLFFKAGFSPQRYCYRTGATVFLPDAYAQLEQRFAAQRVAHPRRPIFHRMV